MHILQTTFFLRHKGSVARTTLLRNCLFKKPTIVDRMMPLFMQRSHQPSVVFALASSSSSTFYDVASFRSSDAAGRRIGCWRASIFRSKCEPLICLMQIYFGSRENWNLDNQKCFPPFIAFVIFFLPKMIMGHLRGAFSEMKFAVWRKLFLRDAVLTKRKLTPVILIRSLRLAG